MKFYVCFLSAFLCVGIAVTSGLGLLWLAAYFHSLWVGVGVSYTGVALGFTAAIFLLQRAERYV